MTATAWPGEGPVLIVSPHLDDAVLSAFALVSSGQAEVLTLFDGMPVPPMRTSWDRLCGFRDSNQAVLARRAENAAAFLGLDVRQHSLGLLDAQYLPGPRSLADRESVVAAVRAWALTRPGSPLTVAVCAGAGRSVQPTKVDSGPRSSRRKAIRRVVGPPGRALLDARARFVVPRTAPIVHEDHVFARDALVEALPSLAVTDLLLYEELPYLWGAPADEAVRRLSASADVPARRLSMPVDREQKAQRIGRYTSQLRYMYSPDGRLGKPQALPPEERYWQLQRSANSAGDG